MLRRLFLQLTDRRLRAALRTICACGAALGDLVEKPEDAQLFFQPHLLRLTRLAGHKITEAQGPARTAPWGKAPLPGSSVLAAAAEDFAAKLKYFFCGIALHKTTADPAVKQALLYLQAACAASPGLLSARRRADALQRIRGLCTTGTKHLGLAKTAADAQLDNFPQNLKFSSMYSDLDAVFSAFERCAAALYES